MSSIALLLAAVFLITTILFYLRNENSKDEIGKLNKKIRDLEENLDDKIQDDAIFYQSRLAQMGEMISMIAHQWRQPLSAISLTAIGLETKILLKRLDFTTPKGIEEAQAYILQRTKLIATYVDSMTTTIDDFRMFYKKDRHKELASLPDIIDRALKIIGASLDTDNILVSHECNCNNILVFPNELVQVFLNLLQNSQDQFMQNGITSAKITISGVDYKDGIRIMFCDNAGGINHLILNKIFRPYFSTKEKQNGTGLGLYMSKIIIDDHHKGLLEVSNVNDEQGKATGACFTITLPLKTEDNDD